MPINNKRAAEQVEQEARKSQAKSFRTNATSTTDQGKGSVAKSSKPNNKLGKARQRAFEQKRPRRPTREKDQPPTSDNPNIKLEKASQRAFEQMRLRRQTREKDQSPKQKQSKQSCTKKPGKELSNRCESDDRPGKRINRRTKKQSKQSQSETF